MAKKQLFSNLMEGKSSDNEDSKKVFTILEIGVGTGTNLEFYPAGSKLICVDYNPAFESYFRRKCATKATHLHPDIQFVTERGEDMHSVADASVDVVVVTKVLCSVEHQDTFVREVRRVLVPGGKFYYIEHTADRAGSLRRRLQDVLSDSGLWPMLFHGCMLNRDPAPVIAAAGFSCVQQTHMVLGHGAVKPYDSDVQPDLFSINPMLCGQATK